MDELYALYRRCFPDYPAAEAVFRECLKRERGQVLYAGEGGETVGYALIHGGSLSLLCVDRRYRNRGHGAALLEAAETRIRASGADRVLLGRGRYYLLQGVPAEDPAVPAFFERRGYAASWTSVNMRLDLRGFGAGRLDIPPAPETVGFRFARDADRAALLAAVLLFLLYASPAAVRSRRHAKLPWFDDLDLPAAQRSLLLDLFSDEPVLHGFASIGDAFEEAFAAPPTA